MKNKLFSGVFRSLPALGLLAGVFTFSISLFPYDVLLPLANKLTSDGSMDAFSQGNWEFLSRLFMFGGGGLAIFCCIAWTFRSRFESWMHKSLLWSRDFFVRTRSDARIFLVDSLSTLRSNNERLLITALTLVGLVPRLANLFIQMEFDEAYLYNAFASHSFWDVITDYHVPNNHIFLTIIVHFLVHTFGNHLWLLRIPSLLAGLLMIPVGYFAARRLYGINAGILSGVFIAFFPILVKYSVLVRGYAFISLFTLLLILLGDYVRTHKNRFAWAVFVLFCALGFYTVPVMLLPAGAVYAWLFLSVLVRDVHSYRAPSEFLKYYLVSGSLVIFITSLLYAPILLNPANRLFGNKFVAPVGWDVYPSAIFIRLQETWNDWFGVIPDWIVFLGAAGLIASFVFYKGIGTHKIPLQGAFFIWILVFTLARRPDMETRMWLFFAAPLLVWSSVGLDGLLKLASTFIRRWQIDKAFAVGALMISVIFAVLLIPSIPGRWAEKGSVENSVLYLKDNIKQGDAVFTSIAFKAQLQYYFGLYEIPLKFLQPTVSFERAYILVRSVGGSPETGDTLVKVAPKSEDGELLVDASSARVVQQYDDLALYEGFPIP